jgi:hypothetical protein
MLGNMLGDRKNLAMLLLGDERGESKPVSKDQGNGGERPEMKAKEAALKEFFAAGNAGNWKMASKALAAFVDLHDVLEDEDDEMMED